MKYGISIIENIPKMLLSKGTTQSVPPALDDIVLHRGRAHPLPDQHNQQRGGARNRIWRKVVFSK